MKVVINTRFGGFGISDEAYEKLGEWGIPIQKYVDEERGKDGRYKSDPLNDGEIVFDRELTPKGESDYNDIYWKYKSISDRYWDCWIRDNRTHSLLIRVVEKLGEKANGRHSKLKVVDVPDDVEWSIEEYDGIEWVAEKHRTWE